MKFLKCTFKLPFLLSTIILDFAKNIVVPGQKLMAWLFIVYIVDFITGITKAYIKNDPITSKKMRDSIGKMLQYAGMIILVMIMANATFKEEIAKASFIIDGIYMLAILIETRSITENFKEMAPESTITKLILNPLLLVFEKQTKAFNNTISIQETNKEPESPAPPLAKMMIIFMLMGLFTSCSSIKTKAHEHQVTAATIINASTYSVDSLPLVKEHEFVKSTFSFAGVSLGLILALILLAFCSIWYVRNNTQLLKKHNE